MAARLVSLSIYGLAFLGYGSPTSGYPGTYPATEAHAGDQAGETSPWGRP
ncbi:MAG: hypothetical protein ACTHMZ_03650 [Actinomycetes bacterium]